MISEASKDQLIDCLQSLGLITSGSSKELRERLAKYAVGVVDKEDKDPNFTGSPQNLEETLVNKLGNLNINDSEKTDQGLLSESLSPILTPSERSQGSDIDKYLLLPITF